MKKPARQAMTARRSFLTAGMTLVSATGFLVALTGLSRLAKASGNDHSHDSRESQKYNDRVHSVEIRNLIFVPDSLEVSPGDKIRWINHDISPHTATAMDERWDTGELSMGQSSTLTVTEEMAGEYYCLFHPHMRGNIKLREKA
ncbi:cupredoxin domain-containing protein [Kiloniella laminariae]|uniref:Cupredoxin domain-containing protein n=1 Tax=Kiloniella laminariae TaxID=454162 RepID=A0ABT4LHT1_9PROT|nr:plastocyanin/azurin family copper-binding protein [Kiloniella laminariae]MCZ4279916.1 cupredoxin domain-containing protein [Kiloniella laminariae]